MSEVVNSSTVRFLHLQTRNIKNGLKMETVSLSDVFVKQRFLFANAGSYNSIVQVIVNSVVKVAENVKMG